jgi:hypothetical protein
MSGLLAEINIRVLHAAGGKRPFKIVETLGFSGGDGGEAR